MRRGILVLLPLVVFLGLAALFYIGLGDGDPSMLPSALIGKPMPKTDLPPIEDWCATASRCRASTTRLSRARSRW